LLDSLLQERSTEMVLCKLLLMGLLNPMVLSNNVDEDENSCCSQVFLSSQGLLAQSNQQSLGIYTISSQKIANNEHPVYIKNTDIQDFYLYFRDKDDDLPRGWVVGPQLLEDSFFLTTNNFFKKCPNGIYGGFNSDNSKDDTFEINCHSDNIKFNCCPSVKVVSNDQQGLNGQYEKIGDYNGRPLYQGGPANTSLYYRKAGFGPDGWVVGMGHQDQNSFMISTKEKSYCPDEVQSGFGQDGAKDNGFEVTCYVADDHFELQDPGIPAEPLDPLPPQKTMSSAARETITSSLFFRLMAIAYILVLKLAEDLE